MTAICVPIFVKKGVDLEEIIGESEDALRGTSGMIELRCDTASEKQMLEAIDLAHVPVIVTIRPTWEGGFSEKTDDERIAMWEAAMEAGANYVDVELVGWEKSRAIREAVTDAAEKNGTRLIVSNHNFERRPKDLREAHHPVVPCKRAGAETRMEGGIVARWNRCPANDARESRAGRARDAGASPWVRRVKFPGCWRRNSERR